MKNKKLLSVVKYIFFLSIGLLLLWYVTKGQDYDLFFNEFKNANYYWIVFAMFCGGISHIFRTLRWNLLINSMGHKTVFSTTFYAVMIGYFANMVVPRLGEVSRCVVLHKNRKIPFNELLGTVIAERVFDMICLLLVAAFVLYFQFDFLKGFIYTYLYAPLMGKISNNFSVFILIFVAFIIIVIAFIIFIKSKSKTEDNNSFFYKIKKMLYGFSEGFRTIMLLPQKIQFLFYTVMIWAMYLLMTYLCFFAMASTSILTVSAGFTVLVMGSAGIVAPVPGGIGAYHFMVISTLVEVYNINTTSATSFAYLSHTSQGVLIGILGAVSFLAIFLQKNKSKSDV
ncbi:MAG: lysylphosphatidylglycerol synthase transmembrane domain-containing protein [Bacteroidales bacterium]|nr:lysylphosphatidylglycerol synthase transmembrane domain-containing protein [Bacteroidales bacterium]